MLDIKLIRENPDLVKRAMKTRNKDMDALVDEILEIDARRRELSSKRDQLKARQNAAGKMIPADSFAAGERTGGNRRFPLAPFLHPILSKKVIRYVPQSPYEADIDPAAADLVPDGGSGCVSDHQCVQLLYQHLL